MKAFYFRYSKILDYRRYLEQKAQADLNAARRELVSIEKDIQQHNQKKMSIERECDAAGLKGVNVPVYHLYQTYLETLGRTIERARLAHNKSLQKVKRREKRLKTEMIKKKTLEKLREFEYQGFLEKAASSEQKMLDEMVIMRKGQPS